MVVLVGRVGDRVFRPGGDRVVVKVEVAGERGGHDLVEVDVYGERGEWALKSLRTGDLVSVRGRLELRVYKDRADGEIEELRVVGLRIDRLAKGSAVGAGAPGVAQPGVPPLADPGA